MIVLKGRSDAVDALAFGPAGELATASLVYGVGQVWPSVHAGAKPTHLFPYHNPRSVRFLADGRVAVSGGLRDAIYDPRTGGVAEVLPDPPADYTSLVTPAPDGRCCVVAQSGGRAPDFDHSLCRRSIADPQMSLWTVPTAAEPAGIAFLDAGRFAAVDFEDRQRGLVTVRRVADGRATHAFTWYGRPSAPFVASPDGSTLVGVGGRELVIRPTEDVPHGTTFVPNTTSKHFTGVAFHPSGRYLAATSNDAAVKVFDTATWRAVRAFDWDVGASRSVAFNADGTLAAAGSDKGRVVVWDFDA